MVSDRDNNKKNNYQWVFPCKKRRNTHLNIWSPFRFVRQRIKWCCKCHSPDRDTVYLQIENVWLKARQLTITYGFLRMQSCSVLDYINKVEYNGISWDKMLGISELLSMWNVKSGKWNYCDARSGELIFVGSAETINFTLHFSHLKDNFPFMGEKNFIPLT